MSTHNICFRGEIRKILCGYPLLSVAMMKKENDLCRIGLNYWNKQCLSKQCGSRSDAAEHSIWSGSTLCATHPAVFQTY